MDLVERFDRNVESYRSGQYNETQLRREFIDPFFKALVDANYTGRVSIDAQLQDAPTEFPRALELMQSWAKAAGA